MFTVDKLIERRFSYHRVTSRKKMSEWLCKNCATFWCWLWLHLISSRCHVESSVRSCGHKGRLIINHRLFYRVISLLFDYWRQSWWEFLCAVRHIVCWPVCHACRYTVHTSAVLMAQTALYLIQFVKSTLCCKCCLSLYDACQHTSSLSRCLLFMEANMLCSWSGCMHTSVCVCVQVKAAW